MESNDVIAPFVMKTYQMVNDSSLDNLIRWGTSNNTFVVVDSLDFSQRLLPAYFKHNNFSSFIRQLNTYGFKKVDPDRWEFANEWFLRGQVHLLKNIGRKKQMNCKGKYSQNTRIDDEDEYEMSMEIARLKQEQKVLEQELVKMNKRLEVTERRPEQMMALLCKVAEDPDILSRMMLEKGQRSKRLVDKKRQRELSMMTNNHTQPMLTQSSSGIKLLNNPIKNEDAECNQTSWRPSPSTTVRLWNKDSRGYGGCDDDGRFSAESKLESGISRYEGGSGSMIYFGSGLPEAEVMQAPAYPFSLLGGGF